MVMQAHIEAPTKQIICIKWGPSYGPEYVNILYSMVARNITGAFQVYCFTDDAKGVRPEVTCLPLPELGCEIPPNIPGKWKKQALWGSDLFGVKGMALFIDLDSIIVGNIDSYFTHGDAADVITARNWLKPWKKMAQTTVFRFEVGRHAYMLDNLRADPERIARKYIWEQNYVTQCVRGGFKTWPAGWTRHFRKHCLPAWPLRYWRDPVLPPGAKIIACPGGPNPSDSQHGHWRKGEEYRTPWAHILYKWKHRRDMPKSFLQEIACYVRPAPWIAQHWRED